MYAITLIDIAVAFIPVAVTLVIILFWSSNLRHASIAILRMLLQLLLIGYALEFIFSADSHWIILAVLSFMLAVFNRQWRQRNPAGSFCTLRASPPRLHRQGEGAPCQSH